MYSWLREVLNKEQADKIIPSLETQKIGLEQAYLYSLLHPILDLQGIFLEDDNGRLKEYVDKETLADAIIEVINRHAKVAVNVLKDTMKELEKEE